MCVKIINNIVEFTTPELVTGSSSHHSENTVHDSNLIWNAKDKTFFAFGDIENLFD